VLVLNRLSAPQPLYCIGERADQTGAVLMFDLKAAQLHN
jgi:hypothetical protein